MIRIGAYGPARAGRRKLTLPNGTGYFRSEIITSPPGGGDAPQAFLVEQDPASVVLPHFHVQNEFQVIVAGDGSLGRHPVRPVTVHYAGAHTGYGPITAGAGGVSYLTLRPRTDPGAQFLPGARDRMDMKAPKRHLFGGPVDVSTPVALAERDTVAVDEVFAPQADGIACWLLRLPRGAAAPAPSHPGGGRYLVVLGGTLHGHGDPLGRFDHVFVSAGEPLSDTRAGNEGLELLVLQFPHAASQ